MDLKLFLLGLIPKRFGYLVIDSTVGGIGFDPAVIASIQGESKEDPKVVRVNVRGGDLNYREDGGAPTGVVGGGDWRIDGDEFFVVGLEAINNFRAICIGTGNANLTYHVYF